MRTVLLTACFLEGTDHFGNSRLKRNERYIEYYSRLREEIGFGSILLLDNASELSSVYQLGLNQASYDGDGDGWWVNGSGLYMYRFGERLERTKASNGYNYVWRAVYKIADLLLTYDKIIAIDSDAFVLSRKLANFIKNCNSGFQSFWCPRHEFPESSMFVLNRDAFGVFKRYTDEMPWRQRCADNRLMEKDLPFTKVSYDFHIDRFGEIDPPPLQSESIDAYLQAPLSVDLKFDRWK